MAIRDNPIAARSMGINTALYKSLTFGVSALYTGVAGALGAIVILVFIHFRSVWQVVLALLPVALGTGV